jgi:predicted transcriptional regulator
MVNFTCKDISLKQIIKCSLGLTNADYKVFCFFLNTKHKELTSEELSKKLKLDISTIQRSLKKLYELNIINREKESIHKRGFIFLYKKRSKKAIKKIIKNNLHNWTKIVEKKINKL